MTRVKFASFNVENLFSRAKVLNFFDHDNGNQKLALVAQLEHELKQIHYDKPKIIQLYDEVEDFISINITRSDIGNYVIARQNGQLHVFADGRKDWSGTIEFKRAMFSDAASRNTARVIREIDAQVLCVIEAEDRNVLRTFNSDRLSRMYRHNVLIDGNDQRGIDVGLYSVFPLGNIRTNIFDGTAQSPTFPRDCLEVEVMTPGGSTYVLVNHFTSKMKGGASRRERQATRVNAILGERYNLAAQRVIVAGDLNDTPNSAPLKPLLDNAQLSDVLKLQFPADAAQRWTYHYDANEQIDYILVSDPLRQAFQGAGVERRGIADVAAHSGGQVQQFSTVTNWRDAASDHGAVWAEFEL